MAEWQEWKGTRDFTAPDLIRVRYRNGMESKQVAPAYKWKGKYGGKFPHPHDFEIVAVRRESDNG